MRGKRHRISVIVSTHRIIPARAGQTRGFGCLFFSRSDHPRACGANMDLTIANAYRPGSSPRVRGKRLHVLVVVGVGRIIPARAGQTGAVGRVRRSCPDHPRACGANVSLTPSFDGWAGSSPRVRGKLDDCLIAHLGGRIIPARAGQTWIALLVMGVSPDHPRACGANGVCGSPLVGSVGSSPRVRGKPLSWCPCWR